MKYSSRIICAMLYSSSLLAQLDTALPLNNHQKIIGFKVDKGNVVIHTDAVKNITGAQPFGISVEFSKQQISQVDFNKSSAYARYGWRLSYWDFDTPILGNGVVLDYFLQPVYKISNRLQFNIRGSIGAAYLSSPYNAATHVDNQNYSQHLTPYLHISSGLGYRVSKHIAVEFATNFNHSSNGNLSQPNKGINWTTSALSVLYNPDDNYLPTYHRVRNRYWQHQPPWFDFGLFYTPSQEYYTKWQRKRNYVLGITAQISKQIGRTNALLFGAEAYYNSITADANTTFANNKSALLAGLFIGHEFLLNRIIFSQSLGYYITPHPAYNSDGFIRIGLCYKVDKNWQVGFNLKAHADESDFPDMRVLYRF